MTLLNTLLEVTIYSAILFGAIWLFRLIMKKHISPAMRYIAWFILIARLLMPITITSSFSFFVVPSAQGISQTETDLTELVEGLDTTNINEQAQSQAIADSATNLQGVIKEETAQNTAIEANSNSVAMQQSEITLEMVLIAIWMIGMAAMLIQTGVSTIRLKRMLKSARAIPPEWQCIVTDIKNKLNLRRRVRVVLLAGFPSPALSAGINPVVVLPEKMLDHSEETVSFASLHEMTHIKRGDHIVSMLLLLLRAVYWFNPVVWFAVKHMRLDMETACDSRLVRPMSTTDKKRYAGTMLSMYAQKQVRYVLGLALGQTKKTAEGRLRSMFMRSKSSRKGKMVAILLTTVLLVTCFTTACQPTPEKPVVINKSDGKLEEKIEGNNTEIIEQTKPYETLARLNFEVEGLPQDYRIIFDAEMDVSDQAAWPVYSVKPAVITQQQADAVRLALLGDKVLYKPGKYRSHEEIERSIDNYQGELECSVKDGHDDLVEIYQGFLKDLYVELDNTPEDIVLEEADTTFKFIESREMPEFYGGKEVIIDENSMRYEWTDEARKNAIEKGCEHIYGVCWLDSGRKMQFSASNGNYSWGISLSVAEGDMLGKTETTYSLDEAVNKADLMLEQMGLDFTLVAAVSHPKYARNDQDGFVMNDQDELVENGISLHSITYKRNIEGIQQDNIVSCLDQSLSVEEDYRSPIMRQETITFLMDDYGIYNFSWNKPMCIFEKETANVELMPFDQVRDRIEKQLKIQTLWEPNDYEKEYIDFRRLEISKVKMSYILVAKKNEMESYYLMPVWNVCGDMYYHYTDSYDNRDETGGWRLDENHERNVWRSRHDTGDFSILTINAIDGSVIPRHKGR